MPDRFKKGAISDQVLLLVLFSEDPSTKYRIVFVTRRRHPFGDGRHDLAEVASEVIVRGMI